MKAPRTPEETDKEKEEKAEQERKLKMLDMQRQRRLRARIAAAQMNTDLEMEEAQNQYEQNRQKKAEGQRVEANSKQDAQDGLVSSTLGRFLDKDDIQMDEVASVPQPSKDPNDFVLDGKNEEKVKQINLNK